VDKRHDETIVAASATNRAGLEAGEVTSWSGWSSVSIC
jgi:hypothetical protein